MPFLDVFRKQWCYGRIPHGEDPNSPTTEAERSGRFELYITGIWEPIGSVQQGWMTVRRKRKFREKLWSWLNENQPAQTQKREPEPTPNQALWDNPPTLGEGA